MPDYVDPSHKYPEKEDELKKNQKKPNYRTKEENDPRYVHFV
jgi:hypothetical protein